MVSSTGDQDLAVEHRGLDVRRDQLRPVPGRQS